MERSGTYLQHWLMARRQRFDFVRLRRVYVLLQARQRMHVHSQRYHQLVRGTTVLQATQRGKSQRANFLRARMCATRIAGVVHVFLLTRRLRRVRAAAAYLNRVCRGLLGKLKARRLGGDYQAASKIQSLFKARVQRLYFQRLRLAAALVHTAARRWLALTAYRRQRKAAVLVQACVRMWSARWLYVAYRAVVHVQAWVRGLTARAGFIRYRTRVLMAVLTLQRMVRGYLSRLSLLKMVLRRGKQVVVLAYYECTTIQSSSLHAHRTLRLTFVHTSPYLLYSLYNGHGRVMCGNGQCMVD